MANMNVEQMLEDLSTWTVKDVADKAEAAARSAAGNAASAIQKAEPEKKGFWRRLFGG